MKKIKSIYLLFYYLFIIGIVFGIIYHKEVGDFIDNLQKSEKGPLVTIYNQFAYYFQNADNWNLIFVIFFLCIVLILFVLNDLIIGLMFAGIARRSKGWKFLTSEFFRFTAQKMITAFVIFFQVVLIFNIIILAYAKKYTIDHPDYIRKPMVVLLLGTNKHIRGTDKENLYYTYRINACEELYKAGKVKYFLISGDKSGETYNEPLDMKKDLIEKNVDPSIIMLDTAGFRTLDSILRLRALFQIDETLIVSQNFHLQRALFLSWFYRMRSYGYKAQGSMTKSMMIREVMAKPKVILDLFFFNMQPRQSSATYRAEFSVTSDLHVILILLLGVLVVLSFTLVVKSFD